ncbi:MAG: MlaE family lipid ABC transporter permease subunit [Deltaproteobacteria bacterium]|nr:MlaE family lipid ABC transporter permease subunit [Deltaproteobacteria bacterium]
MESIVGPLTADSVSEIAFVLDRLEHADGDLIELDLSRVSRVDSAGVALLSVFLRRLRTQGRRIEIVNPSPEIEQTLRLFPFVDAPPRRATERPPALERLGSTAQLVAEVFIEFVMLAADTAWFMLGGLFRRRGIRWSVVVFEMSAMGSRALGVVGLIAFLVGGTMALQSAAQLRQFGANIFVVDLIGISMARELGPLMAAIVVAGRSGSAVAAELGTMMITEEIDALRTMGLHPVRFLLVPKALAISLTQPLLTVFANVLGIFGGFLVAILYLDVSPSAFLSRLREAMLLKDVITGLVKSVVFAQLIVTVGALCGFRTKGGADAVGRSTTTSVVAGIFAVIVADAVASMVFYFGD